MLSSFQNILGFARMKVYDGDVSKIKIEKGLVNNFISRQNETKAWQYIDLLCTKALQSFKTSLEDDTRTYESPKFNENLDTKSTDHKLFMTNLGQKIMYDGLKEFAFKFVKILGKS
jgi:hypothetical protein